MIRSSALGLCFLSLVGCSTAAWSQGKMMPDKKMSQQKMGMGSKISLSAADRAFLLAAAHGNAAEVQEGKLALSQSKSVKSTAQMMVDDHTKAQSELMGLGKSLGVSLPNVPDAKHKMAYATLSKRSGMAFDKAYVQSEKKDHAETIALFRKTQKSTKNDKIRAWATSTLPVLEHHAKMFAEMKL